MYNICRQTDHQKAKGIQKHQKELTMVIRKMYYSPMTNIHAPMMEILEQSQILATSFSVCLEVSKVLVVTCWFQVKVKYKCILHLIVDTLETIAVFSIRICISVQDVLLFTLGQKKNINISHQKKILK